MRPASLTYRIETFEHILLDTWALRKVAVSSLMGMGEGGPISPRRCAGLTFSLFPLSVLANALHKLNPKK